MQSLLRFALVLIALPLHGGWTFAGPYGGSARSLAIDPHNGNTLLVGARDSLLLRSDDGGQTWRPLPFPAVARGVFNSVIIHPTESGHFYAGLDAGDSRDSGVYESKDGGEQWRALPGIGGRRIYSLAISPSDPRVLAAGTSQGVFLSADGGETWQRISRENDSEMQDITALAFDPAKSEIIYAGTPHLPWKTVDAGATWRSIHDGLIDDSDIFSIHVNPERPEMVFASACSGIYRSDNAGDSWRKLIGIPGTHRRTHILAQDPRASGTIYAGTTLGLFKSSDEGRTWRHLTFEQVNGMVFDPGDPRTLYLATEYAGVLKSNDGGEKVHAVNAGFANHNLTQITGDGQHLYASSPYEGLYGGVFVSNDGGLHWTLQANEHALLGRNLNSLTAAPAPNVLFAAAEDAVLRSADGGRTWLPLAAQPRIPATSADRSTARIRIYSLQTVQADKFILLAGTQAGLFRSLNSGASWTLVKDAALEGRPVLSIYVPSQGTSRLAARTTGGLFISGDIGLSWRLASLPDSSYYLYDLALPANADGPILAATSRGILQSVDDGSHWRPIDDGVPAATVDSVRFHPVRPREAFLVQYGKIYQSLDGGSSWKLFPSDGLEQSSVRMLWFARDLPARIFALSAARGALFFDLPQPDSVRRGDAAVSSKVN
ncbi:MAG TPA: YCF48-related protein [Bryobacteraceae bacterium]|nr:YCF48-related protein [Bryobacteraceae bacterium]